MIKMYALWFHLSNIYILFELGSTTTCSFDDKCHCQEVNGSVYADCSRQNLNTTLKFRQNVISIDLGVNNYDFIPNNLPQRLMYLNMTRNPLNKVSATMLARYAELQFLTLSYCRLKEVESGAFHHNKNLRYLDISNNNELSLSVLSNISYDLRNSSIKVLNLENVQCRFGPSQVVPLNYMIYLQNTTLEELNIAGNRISNFQWNFFMFLPKSLMYLNIAANMLTYGYYFLFLDHLQNLQTLNASYQMKLNLEPLHLISDFIAKCDDEKLKKGINKIIDSTYSIHTDQKIVTDNFHALHHKAKENVQSKHVFYSPLMFSPINHMNMKMHFPPNLTAFYFHDNMYKISLKGLTLKSNGRLKQLNVKNNIITTLSGHFLDFSKLQHLDISNSFCSNISDNFFSNTTHLLNLNLSRNSLGNVIETDEKGDLFKDMRNLRVFDSSYNRILKLPKNIFKHMNRLEKLHISVNKLDVFDVQLHHMKKLSFIDLSYNQIQCIDSYTRTALEIISRRSPISVNMNGNHLICTCKEIGFLKWLHGSTNIHFEDISHYKCQYENSSRIHLSNLDLLLRKMELDCASYRFVNTVTSLVIFIFSILIISRIVYRYRWSLQYWYYVAKKVSILQRYTENRRKYHFNAFISYADEDREFVINQISTLEEFGLHLVIHERDFIPGVDIAENITNAIHNSQKTVCVISEHFLRSYWCRFELNMARMESIYSREGENTLFLVIMNESLIKIMPMELLILIETQSYLPYLSDHDVTHSFRRTLAETLQ